MSVEQLPGESLASFLFGPVVTPNQFEAIEATPAILPLHILGEAMVDINRTVPAAIESFGRMVGDFGFSVESGFVEAGEPYELYKASPRKWRTAPAQAMLGSLRQLAGVAAPERCLRDDLQGGEDTGTIVWLGAYGHPSNARQLLLVEAERPTGVALNTERYLQIVPLPGDEKSRKEIILQIANAFSFQELAVAEEVLRSNEAEPHELQSVLQLADRRSVHNVPDLEYLLGRVRAENAARAAKVSRFHQIGRALRILSA